MVRSARGLPGARHDSPMSGPEGRKERFDTAWNTSRDRKVRLPAMSVDGGHGPEGKWPFAKVMRPAPQEALPDSFQRVNLSRRLPFVNIKSKDCTSRCKKGEYFLTPRYSSSFSHRQPGDNLDGGHGEKHLFVAIPRQTCRAETGGAEVVKLRSSAISNIGCISMFFPTFVTSDLPNFLLCGRLGAAGASRSARPPAR
jgi:hypothetical protein